MTIPIMIHRDDADDSLTIEGITYSQEVFRQLGGLLPLGQTFRLVGRSRGLESGTLTIEKVDNLAAQPQGEQAAYMPVERCYDVRAKMIIAFNEAKKAGGDLDDALDAAYKSALRFSPHPMTSDQPAPVAQKYDDTLLPFLALMRKELNANAGKGDRPGWLAMSAETCLLEIFYHLGKLQKAVKKSDGDGMCEYAADVANMCMMLLDICGALHLSASAEPASSLKFDIACDRAYRNGLQAGFNFGISGDEAGFRKSFDAYQQGIVQAGAELKCTTCKGHGVIGWTTGQTPESFDQGEAPCQDCQATGYAHSNGLPVPGTCDTCKGAGVVDDGEITHSEGGIPYENGPVKCVKYCPDCTGPAVKP